MAKSKAKAATGDYTVLRGTVIDGELRRKGDRVTMTPEDASGLVTLGKIRETDRVEAMRIREQTNRYRRRDMNPEDP